MQQTPMPMEPCCLKWEPGLDTSSAQPHEAGAPTCQSGVYLHPARCPRIGPRKTRRTRMKFLIGLALLTAALSLHAANVTYVNHDKVAAALNKGGPLVSAPDLTVSGSHRDKAGHVERHEKETDVMHVIDGEATFVTGGTMVGEKQDKPGQRVGSSITGGETHHLTKGDVIVVPAGTPHWFKEVPHSISYYVVKVLKP